MGDDPSETGIHSDGDKENEEMPLAIEVDENGLADNTAGNEDDNDWEDLENDDDVGDNHNKENSSDSEEGGLLECDPSAYVFNMQLRAGSPCLSFDVLKDDLGDDRGDRFPLSMTLIAGTQEDAKHYNNVLVMRLTNLKPSKGNANQDGSLNDDSEDSDDEDEKPVLDIARIRHTGCINRIKVTNFMGTNLAASWSESGRVSIWDLSLALRAVNDHHTMAGYIQNHSTSPPLFSCNPNKIEGYGLAWSPLVPGMLVTGDCGKNIHLLKPLEGGSWHLDQHSYKGHTASVEDIQWSPNESNVIATCSCDKTIRIWDIRANPERACMLTQNDAHDGDVNVISWNHFDPLILSGGDDGQLKIWDLRNFSSTPAVCTFKHHTAPITSVEWHPTDSTTFAASGADDQISVWDIALERDTDVELSMGIWEQAEDVPSQLLFIHKGQTDIKELHWHPQMPGVLMSTALSGFDVFRTISA